MALPVLAIGAVLKSAAKAIGGFLRAIPLWAWLAFAVLAAAFVYGETKEARGMERGLAKGLAERDKVQSNWDKAVARGKAAIAAKDLANAAAQAKAFADGQALGESRVRDQKDIIDRKDRLIADLGTGNRKLRDLWQGCLSGPQAGDAADLSGGPVPADELRREVAEEISEGFDSDSRISRLIEFVQLQQEFMLRVCPVTLSSR